ncbi:MAG: Hemolysins and related proteins containing CBS domains [uncultured Nocardioidaceae bacterium]|uniref:Hemolysins and related proteins containing CBS domains n=1 Tax=uncultured Nocardioidaceae bacterium TaxID=253824 RepID=A0A6J4LMJ5_9ACTN|nr:MAG: Hemolysins and related proteins containing CBS domains [uncultured Nocardioidaceae bacterium]
MTAWVLLAVAIALVAACGVFVASEFALVTVDRAAVDRAAESGDRSSRGVREALRTLSTQLSGAQVGITVTNLAIGFLAEPAIAELVRPALDGLGLQPEVQHTVSLTAGLLLATGVTMVFGELVPKNLAIADPLRTARATQALMRGFTTAMALPIRALNGSANAVVRACGVEPQEELRSTRTSQELSSLVQRSARDGTLDPGTAGLVQRSVAFGARTADDVMTPRVRLSTIDAREPAVAVLELSRTTGHSRFPVVRGEMDDVIGAVHVKQVVALPRDEWATTPVRSVMGEVTVVPSSLRLDPLLTRLRDVGLQFAVVVDEYGGTAGVVTLEDVVEEIVGEISDEHDPLDVGARRRPSGTWSVSGMLRPDEVQTLTGARLPVDEEVYDTVAGLVLRRLGRMARVGDTLRVPAPPALDEHGDPLPDEETVLRVERLAGLRIDRLELAVRPAQPDAGGRPS